MPNIPVPEFTEYTKLKNSKTFKALMEQGMQLRQDIDVLEAQMAEVKEGLDKLLVSAEVEGSVAYNGWQVRIVEKEGKPKVDMKKLLTVLGPKGPSILKQAMVDGKPSRYVQLSSPKPAKDGDDE